MQEYEVLVELTVSEYITVTAETEDEAIDEATDIFNDGILATCEDLRKHVNAYVVKKSEED